ncbi:MAG: transglutaminase domain-containing protein [Nanoarchaeota archaeon]
MAEGVSFYDKEYIVLDARISSSIDLLDVGPYPSVEYIIADLFFHPVFDKRLDMVSIKTDPSSKSIDSRLRFTWLAPENDTVAFSVDTRLKSKAVYAQIPNKVAYPLSFIPPDVAVYVTETPTVDFSSPEIAKVAGDLTRGEDDLFLLVSLIAAWTRDKITYNLSSVNAKVSKPASWVVKNKQGVCDEITNLFIAVLRASGIPAKFISGLSYTNSDNVKEKWGAHGWAEVYFPGYGWVPFDPTYGQFGWLDPSHIKLKEGLDATEPSTTYEWRAKDVKLGIHPLRFESKVVEQGPRLEVPLGLEVDPAYGSVGLGSHNVILARIANLANTYLDVDLSLGPTEGVSIIGPARKDLSLRPFERVTVSWVVRLDQELSHDFIYTFPMTVYTQRNASAVSSFNASDQEPVLSWDDAIAISKGESDSGRGLPRPDCSPSVSAPMVDQPFKIACNVSMPGDLSSKKVVLCADGLCEILNPPVGGLYELKVQKRSPGKQETLVTLHVANLTSYGSVLTTVLDSPRMVLYNASAPSLVGYDDRFNLSVSVRRESLAMPRVATLTVRLPGFSSSWPIPESPVSSFSIAMSGSDIAGAGGLDVILRYEGDSGKIIEERKQLEVSIKSLNALQSIRMLFARLGFWIHDNVASRLVS